MTDQEDASLWLLQAKILETKKTFFGRHIFCVVDFMLSSCKFLLSS